jgi:ELWxxDGT repeat protein
VLVKDINTENGGRRSDYLFTEFTVFNGALYFQARDNVNGPRLWKTDGTAAGTVLVKDSSATATGSNNSGFTDSNAALYFVTGSALWKTDGTAAGTQLLKDICPGPCNGPL